MRIKKESAVVGIFVILGFVISMGILFFILGYDFNENRKTYLFRFAKLSGIKEGSKVLLKGYQVGEVVRIEPTFGSNIYFRAWGKVDKDLILYRGTTAVVTNQNVIGDATVVLQIPKAKDHLLKEGHTIFATGTQNIDELISSMARLTKNLNNLVSSLGSIAGGNKAGVANVIAGINGVLTKVNRILATSEGAITQIMANMAVTTRTLRRFARDIRKNPLILLKGK